MKHILKIISILALVSIINACESDKKDESAKGKKKYDKKFAQIKKGEKVFFGIGKVKGIRNHSLARITAGNRARAEIIQTGKKYISHLVHDFAKAKRKKYDLNPLIHYLNKATRSDIGIVTNKYIPNKRIWYSLARLDLVDFIENINELDKIDPEIRKYIRRHAARVYKEFEKKNQSQKNSIRKIFGKNAKQFSS